MKGSIIVSLLLMAATSMAQADLPRAIDGSWYSPLQSGHGLTIERVDADSAVLFWHVFDLDGKPMTLYVDAQVEGNRMRGDAFAPAGMRFGTFNASELMLPRWGRVTLDFSDCRNAQLRYFADDAAFGMGGMALTRLLPLPDADCRLDLPTDFGPLAGQRIRGEFDAASSAIYSGGGDMIGVVAHDGKIYVTTLLPGGVSHENNPVMIGVPLPATAGEPRHEVTAFHNQWYCAAQGPDNCAVQLPTITPHFETSWKVAIHDNAPVAATIHNPGADMGGLIRPRLYWWSAPDEGGFYVPPDGRRFPIRYQPSSMAGGPLPAVVEMELTLASDGQLVIARDQQPILFGSWTPTQDGGFDFELQRIGSNAPPWRGHGYDRRAFALLSPHGVLMIGDNGQTGMALQSGTLK